MRFAVVSVVLASVLLAAIFTCPCPAMAADGHGCCADETASVGPADCCRTAASPGESLPRLVPAAPTASFVAVSMSILTVPSSPLPATSAVSLPASPPRVLRI